MPLCRQIVGQALLIASLYNQLLPATALDHAFCCPQRALAARKLGAHVCSASLLDGESLTLVRDMGTRARAAIMQRFEREHRAARVTDLANRCVLLCDDSGCRNELFLHRVHARFGQRRRRGA